MFDLVRSVEEQSIVVVVSPLTALMKNQVAACHSKGLTAAACIFECRDLVESAVYLESAVD